MEEVIIRYETTTGLQQTHVISVNETVLNLELRNTAYIDLLPLIWCSKLEKITLRYNELSDLDLTPLDKCINLETLQLGHNKLTSIDLEPLSDCPHLREVDLGHNLFERIDISPLFHVSELQELKIDENVTLTADLLLKSIGSWPDVLVDRFHEILWKATDM